MSDEYLRQEFAKRGINVDTAGISADTKTRLILAFQEREEWERGRDAPKLLRTQRHDLYNKNIYSWCSDRLELALWVFCVLMVVFIFVSVIPR